MNAILHNHLSESSFSSQNLLIQLFYKSQLYALNGILLHRYIKHGAFSMNLIDILKSRILIEFPNITSEELAMRLELAQELLRKI